MKQLKVTHSVRCCTTAAELGKKFYTLYKLSGDLLGGNPSPPGKQLHYDWGLRAIGSVLKVAGTFLRAEMDREVVAAMRLRDSVVMLAASKGEQGMAQAFLGEAMGNLVSLAQG